jgi:hypothetical protein
LKERAASSDQSTKLLVASATAGLDCSLPPDAQWREHAPLGLLLFLYHTAILPIRHGRQHAPRTSYRPQLGCRRNLQGCSINLDATPRHHGHGPADPVYIRPPSWEDAGALHQPLRGARHLRALPPRHHPHRLREGAAERHTVRVALSHAERLLLPLQEVLVEALRPVRPGTGVLGSWVRRQEELPDDGRTSLPPYRRRRPRLAVPQTYSSRRNGPFRQVLLGSGHLQLLLASTSGPGISSTLAWPTSQ